MNTSMRILMAAGVPRRREGGVAAIIYNLGRELQSRGHQVTYIFYDDLLAASESIGRFRDLRFAIRLANHIRANRDAYSIVNLHAPAGFVYGLLRSLLLSKNYPPYVMTLHGLEERRVHVMSREARKNRAWHFSLENRLWHLVFHRPRFALAIRTANAAHCYSRDVWTMLQLKYDLEADKVSYIPNGVEPRFFIERKYTDRKPIRLLYAGTWLDQRGIFYLRDALHNLNRRFRDWTFTVAGVGAMEGKVKDFFGETLKLQVSVVANVPANRMPELYAEHDVFVFPSLMEGLPGVLLEAMASGIPVITTETCGMVDVVEDGFNGLLVRPADAEDLTQAIQRLCENPELRRKLGTQARVTMCRHTWDRAAEKLENLFALAAERQE